MSYTSLEIWKPSKELVIRIHEITLSQLPKFEMYEEGSQIRRSSKSIRSNIVEGYGRRHYKQDFIHFLFLAKSSADETLDHLNILWETHSLKNAEIYSRLSEDLDLLNRKLSRFIDTARKNHKQT